MNAENHNKQDQQNSSLDDQTNSTTSGSKESSAQPAPLPNQQRKATVSRGWPSWLDNSEGAIVFGAFPPDKVEPKKQSSGD